jgi:Ca-activated chloride channel family protein
MGSTRATARPVLLALGLAAALAVTGCGGSRSSNSSAASGAPAPAVRGPAPNAPQNGQGQGEQDGESGPSDDGARRGTVEVDPARVPQSTFAMDVDTASYGYARALLGGGGRPAPDQVRPEEFVNAFRQDYPQPEGNGFTVTMDGTRLPEDHRTPGGDVRLLRVGLQTRAEDRATRPDAALTVVVDVSGSMADPGKLDVVREALHALVDAARPTDALALVTFSDEARVVLPMTALRERDRLHEAIGQLQARGSTGLEDGLVTGYRVAGEGFKEGATNRVVLLSDGLANVGATDAAPILERVREQAQQESRRITMLGVAVGRDYGDAMMEQLADRGDGVVVYVDAADQARRAFVDTLPAALPVRALDAKVQVTFDPRTVASYRLVGYDDRRLANQDFRDDRVDGGEVFAGHGVTALYLVRLRPGAGGQVAHTQLRWQDPDTHKAYETGADVAVADLDAVMWQAAPRLQVDYAAAFFAEQLRGSADGAQVPAAVLAQVARVAADRTEDAAVRDLAELIRRTGG